MRYQDLSLRSLTEGHRETLFVELRDAQETICYTFSSQSESAIPYFEPIDLSIGDNAPSGAIAGE